MDAQALDAAQQSHVMQSRNDSQHAVEDIDNTQILPPLSDKFKSDLGLNTIMSTTASSSKAAGKNQRHRFDSQPLLDFPVGTQQPKLWRLRGGLLNQNQAVLDGITASSTSTLKKMGQNSLSPYGESGAVYAPTNTVDFCVARDFIFTMLTEAIAPAFSTSTNEILEFKRPCVPFVPDIIGYVGGRAKLLIITETKEVYAALARALAAAVCGTIDYDEDSLPTVTKDGDSEYFECSLNGIMRKAAIYACHYGVKYVFLVSLGGFVVFHLDESGEFVDVQTTPTQIQPDDWMTTAFFAALTSVRGGCCSLAIDRDPTEKEAKMKWPKHKKFYDEANWEDQCPLMRQLWDGIRGRLTPGLDMPPARIESLYLHKFGWARPTLENPGDDEAKILADVLENPSKNEAPGTPPGQIPDYVKPWLRDDNPEPRAPKSVFDPVVIDGEETLAFTQPFSSHGYQAPSEKIEPDNWFENALKEPLCVWYTPSAGGTPGFPNASESKVFINLDQLAQQMEEDFERQSGINYTMDELRGMGDPLCTILSYGPNRIYRTRADWRRAVFRIERIRNGSGSKKHSPRGVVITGQPGIGKSAFLYFLLKFYLGMKIAVLHISRMNGAPSFILYTEDGIYIGPNYVPGQDGKSVNIPTSLLPHNFVVLIDTEVGDDKKVDQVLSQFLTENSSPFVIYTTSPTSARWNIKNIAIEVFLMSPWSYKELKYTYAAMFLSDKLVTKEIPPGFLTNLNEDGSLNESGVDGVLKSLRNQLLVFVQHFLQFGPTPRGCLFGADSVDEMATQQSDALGSIHSNLVRTPYNEGDSSDQDVTTARDWPHRIMVEYRPMLDYIRPRDNIDPHVQATLRLPISLIVRNDLQTFFLEQEAQQRYSILKHCLSIIQLRGCGGGFFENFCHDLFCSGKKWKFKSAKSTIPLFELKEKNSRVETVDKNAKMFVPSQMPDPKIDLKKILSGIESCADLDDRTTISPGVYYQPVRKTQAGFDGITLSHDGVLYIFQITLMTKKFLVMNFLDTMLNISHHANDAIRDTVKNTKNWKFIFVQPKEDQLVFSCEQSPRRHKRPDTSNTESTTAGGAKKRKLANVPDDTEIKEFEANWFDIKKYLLRLPYTKEDCLQIAKLSTAARRPPRLPQVNFEGPVETKEMLDEAFVRLFASFSYRRGFSDSGVEGTSTQASTGGVPSTTQLPASASGGTETAFMDVDSESAIAARG